MGNYKAISKEIKDQILNRIKNDGITAVKAATDAGISVKTVYNWMSTGIAKDCNILEITKLKKENQFLMQLIAKLTVENEKQKGKKSIN
jgi:transposase